MKFRLKVESLDGRIVPSANIVQPPVGPGGAAPAAVQPAPGDPGEPDDGTVDGYVDALNLLGQLEDAVDAAWAEVQGAMSNIDALKAQIKETEKKLAEEMAKPNPDPNKVAGYQADLINDRANMATLLERLDQAYAAYQDAWNAYNQQYQQVYWAWVAAYQQYGDAWWNTVGGRPDFDPLKPKPNPNPPVA
jgi:hypothetical protein